MTARKLLPALLVAAFLCFPAKRAKAIDPVTIAILTPIAVKAARQASPYIIRSMRAGSAHLLKTGKHMLNIFLLPLGCVEMTLGAPLGMFGNGVDHAIHGVGAPFLLVYDVLCMPLAFCGLSP